MHFVIKKQKIYEAFVNDEPQKALLILRKEMNGLQTFYDSNVMSELLLTDKAREHAYFVDFVDIQTSRASLCLQLNEIIKKHPSLSKKWRLPGVEPSMICNQSLNWQHSKSVKEFDALLKDHTRGPQVPHRAPIAPSLVPYNMGDIPIHEDLGISVKFDSHSPVTAFDLHPIHVDVIAVGTEDGGFKVFTFVKRVMLRQVRGFKQWGRIPYSSNFKCNTQTVSVSSIKWSLDGFLLGVGYSKNLVHVYDLKGTGLREVTEIEAHPGHVSDLAFLTVGSSLLLATCGNEHIVKIWDVRTGIIQYTLKGHNRAVCSISLRQSAQMQVIYAIDAVGMLVMAWELSDPVRSFSCDPQGSMVKKIAFSSDGSRIFTSGHNQSKKPLLQEWTDAENHMKVRRNYSGLVERSGYAVSFAHCGRMLAVGHDNSVTFWDIDQEKPVFTKTIHYKFLGFPIVRFSKEGVFLALLASDKRIIILGNDQGARMAQEARTALQASSSGMSLKLTANAASTSAAGGSVHIHDRSSAAAVLDARSAAQNQNDNARDLNMPSQIRSLKLSYDSPILRLVYALHGDGILALTSTAANKLWRWEASRATTSKLARDLQSHQFVIHNDTTTPDIENRVACLAISKDTCHALSASGGKVSVIYISNTMQHKTSIISPPPVATCLAFDPRNFNMVCAGMEDGSLLICDVLAGKVLKKLSGHRKCVTGLAYFINGNVLASSGADDQLCLWELDSWEKKLSKILRLPPDRTNNSSQFAATRVLSQPGETCICMLVINGAFVATYDPLKLDCIRKWGPPPSMGLITDAVYSCDGQWIYVLIQDGSVCVLAADKLSLKCCINYAAYVPSNPSFPKACPAAIAANPYSSNQFALGFSDGAIYVIEPLASENQWGYDPLPRAANL